MAPPLPPVEIRDPCSVIYNETLYVYTADAFQALPLREGGEWFQLPMGVSVSGASCARAVSTNDPGKAALYIVGGVAKASTSGYPGLQRYSFAESSWETITPHDSVTQNRQNHASIYLSSTSSILVYAGNQGADAGARSSQTFVLSVAPPYNVQAFNSIAPPVVDPQLLPWNESHVAMVGGDPENRKIYIFNADTGWYDLGFSLQSGLPDRRKALSTIIHFDDGSKVLQTYDASVSPNTVTQTILPVGVVQTKSVPRSVELHTKREKRGVTISNWPPYNSTLAPQSTRLDFSIAQGPRGLAVLCGGNAQLPIVLFNERQNTWVDTTAFFNGQQATQSTPVSSNFATPTSSTESQKSASSSTSPKSATHSPSHGTRSDTLTILGAALGAVFGILLIVSIILLLLRRKRKQRKHRTVNSYFKHDKNRLSFADRGADFMKEPGGTAGLYYSIKSRSNTSSPIITGRAEPGHKRGGGPHGSDASTAGLVPKKSSLRNEDVLEMKRISDRSRGDVTAEDGGIGHKHSRSSLISKDARDGGANGHKKSLSSFTLKDSLEECAMGRKQSVSSLTSRGFPDQGPIGHEKWYSLTSKGFPDEGAIGHKKSPSTLTTNGFHCDAGEAWSSDLLQHSIASGANRLPSLRNASHERKASIDRKVLLPSDPVSGQPAGLGRSSNSSLSEATVYHPTQNNFTTENRRVDLDAVENQPWQLLRSYSSGSTVSSLSVDPTSTIIDSYTETEATGWTPVALDEWNGSSVYSDSVRGSARTSMEMRHPLSAAGLYPKGLNIKPKMRRGAWAGGAGAGKAPKANNLNASWLDVGSPAMRGPSPLARVAES